jgi:thimet oligopeptidase
MSNPTTQTTLRLLIAVCVSASLPAFAETRPLVKVMDAKEIAATCDAALSRAAATVKAMEAKVGDHHFLREWNDLQIDLENTGNPIYLLANVHIDKVTRDAGDACTLKLTTFGTDLFQNEKIFKRLQAVKPNGAHAAKLKKDLTEGFEDTGVSLPVDKRARAKAIFEKMEELRQTFDRNVRDAKTRVVVSKEEQAGLPADYLATRKPDDKGAMSLSMEYPDYNPFMQTATNEAARERYYRAFTNRGGEKNLALLDEIAALRKELGGLYGFKSFADYALRRKMVENTATATKFLADVKGAVTIAEKREVDELAAEKAKFLAKPATEVKLQRWDIPFLQERVKRERFKIDQEALRKYFPTDAAIAYTLLVSETLYGVKFKQVKVASWHPDVRYYDVTDAKTGKFISGFYLDLFPREGKYGHAAAFPVRGVSKLANRTALSVLVTNFNRVGLNFDEMETLLHEFGHVLHGVLSQTDYNPHGGTNTLVDFVEAPSQMFEEWARREDALKLFATVCKDCPKLEPEMIKRLDEARRFGRGIRYARQLLYADFDLALASENPGGAMAVWKAKEGATPIGHVEGTMFPANFSHIAGGYGAGYYGYMWSEVIALDMLSAFSKNMMDPVVGKRYRDTILANGGQVAPKALVKQFLGRDADSRAFFAEVAGERK